MRGQVVKDPVTGKVIGTIVWDSVNRHDDSHLLSPLSDVPEQPLAIVYADTWRRSGGRRVKPARGAD